MYNLGNLLEFDYYAKDDKEKIPIESIKEASPIQIHSEKFNHYKMLNHLCFLLETIESVSKEEGSPELFLVLSGSIEQLVFSSSDVDFFLLFIFVHIRCLKFLGAIGEDSFCSSCEDTLSTYALWQFPQMHFICSHCATDTNKNDILITRLVCIMRQKRFTKAVELLLKENIIFNDIEYLADLTKKIRQVLVATTQIKCKTTLSI